MAEVQFTSTYYALPKKGEGVLYYKGGLIRVTF